MRLALTLYDDNGSVEITSVDGVNFVGNCVWLSFCLSEALEKFEQGSPSTTASSGGATRDILTVLNQMGTLEDLPVCVSC